MNYIKTDRFQRVKPLGNMRYNIIDAVKTADGKFLIQDPWTIDVSIYRHPNGAPSKGLVNIIEGYYGDVLSFYAEYPDDDTRNQILAEMIYETNAGIAFENKSFPAEQTKKIIDGYVKTGRLEVPNA